ncbi:MAG: hypothetical protein N2C14_17945 [Planctomycetales bacterium]
MMEEINPYQSPKAEQGKGTVPAIWTLLKKLVVSILAIIGLLIVIYLVIVLMMVFVKNLIFDLFVWFGMDPHIFTN